MDFDKDLENDWPDEQLYSNKAYDQPNPTVSLLH
jgi:hypothetical protein